MLLWGFWALLALQSPAPSGQLALGLATVVAAAVLITLAAAVLRLPAPPPAAGLVSAARRRITRRLPRLLDPDAAGRPRPRAPTAHPEAA